MRPPSCDHVRASFAPCHLLRHQAVHAQSHFVTLVPWIGRNALRGRGDTRPRVLRRLVLRMAAPWEKEGGDGVPWARGGAEGNVERGLREDRDALLMGKRQDGRVACGSGFGGADAVTLWNLLPPNVTDCYSCVSELGRGTFGTVILAENRNASATPRRVAVKLCRPNDSEVGMMLKEGMALQRLNSPMIARLVHMGCVSANGGLVYTMLELLQGKSVHEMLTERGPLGIAEACRVGINVLDGLRDVHRAGFIHRDIKPQNIICVELEDGSRVYKLIDFGTATGALGVGRVGLPAFVPVDGEDSGGGRGGAGKGKAVGMRQVFDSIDYQQNGQLSYEDVFRSLASLGLRTDAATIQDLVQKYDADGNGVIEFQEFGQMYGELVGLPYAAYGRSSSNLPILEEAFKSLTGDTGRMSLAMLEQCFASLQRQMPPERVRALFDKYDTNGDGTLMLEEFIPMFGELVAMQDAMNWQARMCCMVAPSVSDVICCHVTSSSCLLACAYSRSLSHSATSRVPTLSTDWRLLRSALLYRASIVLTRQAAGHPRVYVPGAISRRACQSCQRHLGSWCLPIQAHHRADSVHCHWWNVGKGHCRRQDRGGAAAHELVVQCATIICSNRGQGTQKRCLTAVFVSG